jgi:1-acyl-sn-glycerol-3-phosphate acyltransferase
VTLYGLAKALIRGFSKPLFALTVEGEQRVPRTGGLVVAANHRSYLDPPLLGAWFPRTVQWMAKKELFKIPIFGPLIKKVYAFPVDREQADLGSVRRALHILKEGGVVGVFPEGRRNLTGDAEPKAGAVLLAAMARCPLVPVYLENTQQAVRRLRASRVRVVIGEPMRFQGTQRKPTKAELTEWTDQVTQAIASLGNQKA